MKPYSSYSQASNQMTSDETLKAVVRRIMQSESIDVVMETGTYNGTGSTTILAEAFQGRSAPRHFYTCELSFYRYLKARKNLAKYPFVQCLWGRSVALKEALEFMNQDDALRHPEKSPGIFTDWTSGAAEHYAQECRRGLTSDQKAFRQRFDPRYYWMKWKTYQGEDLLRRILSKHRKDRPFILLDSAGGIGFLEFKIVREIMGENPYWLLLDDVHHIKHFRSVQEIQKDSAFEILASDPAQGWALAKHR